MKSKRFLCTVLACVVMISCITNAAAIQEEVADDFVEYNTESILTMMTSVLMTTVLAVDTERDIVVPETLTEEAQGDLAGTIIYGSESIRRLPMTETSRNLDTKSWTTLYSDNNWLNEIATITNKMGNPGSIYVRVVAYDKNKTAHTIVSKSPEIGVGASYETPVIDKDYAKYTVSIMAASTDGTYSIRYHD